MLISLDCSSDFIVYKSQMYTLNIYSSLLKKKPSYVTSLMTVVCFTVWKPLRAPST